MSRVLVVDDERFSRDTIRNYLTIIGNDVITASDGEEGLYLYKKDSNGLVVLTDVNMPRMDGFKLLSEIRKINPGALVYVMSGNDENGKIVNYGASGFIKKPFELGDLEMLLNNYKE